MKDKVRAESFSWILPREVYVVEVVPAAQKGCLSFREECRNFSRIHCPKIKLSNRFSLHSSPPPLSLTLPAFSINVSDYQDGCCEIAGPFL